MRRLPAEEPVRAQTAATTPARPPAGAAASVLALQRSAGNAAVGRMLARYTEDPQFSEAFPNFSQGAFVTCGAASLLTQVLVWDAQRGTREKFIAACEAIENRFLKKLPLQTKAMQKEYNFALGWLSEARLAAMRGQALTESQYQAVARAFYGAFASDSGMAWGEARSLHTELGLSDKKIDSADTLHDLFDTGTIQSLLPGDAAQGFWFAKGGGPHVFLIGRLKDNTWYVHDSAPNPPMQLEQPTREKLRDATIAAAGTPRTVLQVDKGDTTISTGALPMGSGHGLSEKTSRSVDDGEFIAEVDAGWSVTGESLVCEKLVSKHADADSAEKEWLGLPDYKSGLILERPQGIFTLYLANTVSRANLQATSIDQGDSDGAILTDPARKGTSAYLMLCSDDGYYRRKFKVH